MKHEIVFNGLSNYLNVDLCYLQLCHNTIFDLVTKSAVEGFGHKRGQGKKFFYDEWLKEQ